MIRERYAVDVQVDVPYPDDRRVRPSSVWFDTPLEAAGAMARALKLPFAPGVVTVMVSREIDDEVDVPEEPDLDDWPAERHIVTGPMTEEDV